MKVSRILAFLGILTLVVSCVKDEFSFDDLSKDVKLDRELAIPLVKGEFVFEDITDESWDSLYFDTLRVDTIKLYLIDGIEQTDTMPLGEQLENMSFEYLNLHHTFTNMFPVGVDVQLYLRDSIANQNIDTIYLSENPNEFLLPPAPVDEDGLVIESEVQPRTGVAALDSETLFNLTERTTHLIFFVYVPPTTGFVKILDHYLLALKIGVEAKGEYITTLDSDN
jgi:hypothetical protein